MFYITWSEKLDQTSAEGCSDTPMTPQPMHLEQSRFTMHKNKNKYDLLNERNSK